ncbi:MAG: 30S ribosomal protein S18 [Deltaproteobacteria bacterium]|nr:30S ribosomal protein S18 [Deltaproteobacteria bacterium]MCL5277542.1 30S ribosomal protein S18 [Deltaproteobacteria bacterium]
MEERKPAARRKPIVVKKRVCRFCNDKNVVIDYKSSELLTSFISERGKILPRRLTGTCARHQRALTVAIKRARILALLPFTTVKEKLDL